VFIYVSFFSINTLVSGTTVVATVHVFTSLIIVHVFKLIHMYMYDVCTCKIVRQANIFTYMTYIIHCTVSNIQSQLQLQLKLF